MKLKSKQERAEHLVASKGIKLHQFLPSGREIWTAVGNEGDQLIDASQPYCSCKDFHFRLLTDKKEECYHLLAFKLSQLSKSHDIIVFQDAEYVPFIRSLIKELPHEG